MIFTVNNPNDYPVTFTSLHGRHRHLEQPDRLPGVQRHGDHPGRREHPGRTGAASTAQTVASVTNMVSNADNLCQGVTFTVALTLTGASS